VDCRLVTFVVHTAKQQGTTAMVKATAMSGGFRSNMLLGLMMMSGSSATYDANEAIDENEAFADTESDMNPAAAGASVLLPDDAFTKAYVDQHVGATVLPRNFEKLRKTHSTFHKMEAEGTAKFVRSSGTRPSVYGCTEIHVKNPEKWKADLEGLSQDYIAPGGRAAPKDRLGPVYEIGFCATGVGVKERKKRGGSAMKEGEGKKTQALLRDHFIFSEDTYAKNKNRLFNNNQKSKAAAGDPPPATDATGAAPLSLATPAAPTTPKKKRNTLTRVATPPTVEQKPKRPKSSCEPESFLTCPIGYEYAGPLPRKTGLVQGEAEEETKGYLASIPETNFETNALYLPGDDSSAWAPSYLPEEELEETAEEIEEKEEIEEEEAPKLRALDLPEERNSLTLDLPLEPLLLEQQVALLLLQTHM
jgi:hypothetical protein